MQIQNNGHLEDVYSAEKWAEEAKGLLAQAAMLISRAENYSGADGLDDALAHIENADSCCNVALAEINEAVGEYNSEEF